MKNIYVTLPTILLAAFLLWVPVVVTNFTVDTAVAHALGGNNGGSGGSGGSSGGNCCTTTPRPTPTPTPTPTPSPILPECVISANPGTITTGGNSTLTWTTTRATSASINQSIGAVGIGSNITRVVSPTGTVTYTMTVRSSTGHTASCNTTVTVTPVHVPAPVCELSANPVSITRGGSSQLTWTSQNAVSASFNQSIGAVVLNGTRSVTPENTTEYVLTVKNSAGVEVICKKTITVEIPTPLPVCDSFTASPTSLPVGGGSVNLAWNTTNATTVTLDGQTVDADGSLTRNVTANKTFTLNLSNTAGTKSCTAAVTVNQPDAAITCAANVQNFSASPTSIRRGDSSTLTWSTTGLTSVSFTNLNSTGLSGSVTVSPSDTTTYTLIGKKGSETIECPVRVDVSTSNGGGGGGSSAPKCTLKISDNKISLGERITIKWDTTRATEVTLKDNHGKTLVDTDDKSSSAKKELYDGEITLRPEKDTTYTLVAEKGSRDKTCKVSVDVEDTVVVTQIRDQQPLVTGIALTNVPYTGFEAGSFMTSVFYTLLAAWALYMAYVLVGRRNGMNASAFTPAMVTADVVPATEMFAEKVTSAPVFYQAPVAQAPLAATVGYEAHTDLTTTLEAQAHAAHVLVSADALAYFIAATAGEDRAEILSGVLAAAKASYPSEGGWVSITADRMVELASKN